jgi:zinc protease
MRFALLVPLLAALLTPSLAAAGEPAAGPKAENNVALKAAAALYDGVRTEKLDNGLRVYLKPISSAPTVTTMMAYKVGSSDEDLTATGLSHYLEHLMFKGTDKLMPGDIDRLTLRNGGANNAYTTEDYTIFYFDFSSDRWPIALEVEADRMRNLRIDTRHEFEQEKGAVINELTMDEDRPWDLEQKALLPLLFGEQAPYGHPVIGERAQVLGATARVIKAHYDKWYHPNNASLVIVGGFDPDEALAKVKKLFGPIPAAKLPERKPLPKELPRRPARLEMTSKFDSPRLLMSFNTVRMTDPDDAALDVAEAVLAGGRTGRLYKTLVEGKKVATRVNASSATGRYPGWFSIQVELLPDKDPNAVEKLVLQVLKELQDEPVAGEELKRAQQGVLADLVFSRESVHGLADSIARGVTVADLDWLKNYLPRIMAVTAKDVQKVMKQYFNPESRVVVWSLPRKGPGAGGGKPGAKKEKGEGRHSRRAGAADLPKEFSLKKTRRVELPNGLVLLLYENRRLPIFVAEASVRHVALLEPADQAGVATLTGDLLQEGTARHSGPQIAEAIENVGGLLTMAGSGGSVKVLSPDRNLGLGLLFECLSQADFPEEAFARQKQRLLSTIKYRNQQPDARAQAVFRELAYGKHPFGRSLLTQRETIARLTRDDCRAFYRKAFVPNNTVVAVVGDFDSDALVDEVKGLTAGWKKADLEVPPAPPVERPQAFTQKIITMPEAKQLHIFMGHVGVRRDNPDYYKLLVMDYVLGTGPGFTDRLSARLRDREGLAYTVSANISSSAGEEPGLFTCYIGTDPTEFGTVKKEFLEELNRIRDKAPSEKEVEDAKQYLIYSLPFNFSTNADIAGQLLYVERNRLGFNYVEDFIKGVSEVTPTDVQAVARLYVDPTHMVLVAAGPVDARGKVLGQLSEPKK